MPRPTSPGAIVNITDVAICKPMLTQHGMGG
jgi:hypothetical protein